MSTRVGRQDWMAGEVDATMDFMEAAVAKPQLDLTGRHACLQ